MNKGKNIFKAYEASQYKEMMSLLANLDEEQFQAITLDEMTLLHHVAFDGNIEVFHMLKSLPYFRDVVDSDNNEMGWTPLLWAASRGEVEMVKALVKEGGA